MSKLHAAVAAVFMLGAAGLFAAQMDDDTANFIKNTMRDGKHEVAMGKMAADRGTNAEVKKFGQMLADDHNKANQELTELAQKMNFDVSKIDFADQHKQHADQFDKATGAAFDRAFMNWAIEDHNKGIDSFQNYIKSGKNADVVAFAGRWLPGLKNHLQMARDLNDKISKGAMADEQINKSENVSIREQNFDNQQPLNVSEERSEFRSEQAAPVTKEENISVRERSIDQKPALSERRDFHAESSEPVSNRSDEFSARVEEPYSEQGAFVSYDNDVSSDCNVCETKCDSCNTCDTCGDFEDVMYDGDYRDGITHEVHDHN
jgi:putative membrane protein